MRALLLAAGFGKRLLPLTKDIPKCLVDFNGKPLLHYWIKMLVEYGIKEILVNTHYLSEKVENFIKESEYKKYINVVYENRLLGTGGTLLKNQNFFKNESFLLIHADNLSFFNLQDFIESHYARKKNIEITMMTFLTDKPKSCGIVNIDKDGIVRNYYEKSETSNGNIANAAVFIIEPTIFNYLSKSHDLEIDFSKDIIPKYINKIQTFENKIYHRDIGTIESYEIAKLDFIKFNEFY